MQMMETTIKAIDFHYRRMSDSLIHYHLRVHQSARYSHQPNWCRLSVTFIGLGDIWLTFQPENTKRGNVIWHPSILGRTRMSAGNSTAIVQIISPNNWEEAASCWRYCSPESKDYDQTKVVKYESINHGYLFFISRHSLVIIFFQAKLAFCGIILYYFYCKLVVLIKD